MAQLPLLSGIMGETYPQAISLNPSKVHLYASRAHASNRSIERMATGANSPSSRGKRWTGTPVNPRLLQKAGRYGAQAYRDACNSPRARHAIARGSAATEP